MRLKAPGWPWLLAHELRLGWRTSKAAAAWLGVLVGLLWLILHAVAWLTFARFDPGQILSSPAIVVAGGVTWFLLLFTLASAFGLAVVALFERGDFDLLLSSPIRPRAIFVVRGLAVATQSIVLTGIIWVPFANGGILHGYWWMLAGYPVMAAIALGVTGFAFAATLALVRAFGVRRAKVIAQVLGVLAGAVLFLASQAVNLLPAGSQRALASWIKSDAGQAWFGPQSALWLPARAVFGDAGAAAIVVVAGVSVFILVILACERVFLDGTRESDAPATRARTDSIEGGKFVAGLARVVIIKELRLLRRDPHLISQVLLQALYLLPLVFIVMRRGTVTEVLAPAIILICASLSGNLAWMTISGEEAPDLVRSAPVRARKVLWLKVAAALVAPVAISVPFIVIYASQSLFAFASFFACLAGCLASAAVVQVKHARPGSGRDLKKRVQSSKLANLVELVATIGWAGACYALLHLWMWPAAGGVVVGLALPLSIWYFGPDPLEAQAA